jgi:hypothetical protein
LDINFQKQAFGSLQEREKQAMFENAKLKDEVAIQGIGIGNLNARLARQKYAYDLCKKEMSELHERSRYLKDKLSDATAFKNQLLRQKESFQNEYKSLVIEKKSMTRVLKQHYHMSDGTEKRRIRDKTATDHTTTDHNNNNNTSPSSAAKKSNKDKASSQQIVAPEEEEDDNQDAITKELTNLYVSLKEQLRDARSELQKWHHRHLAIQEILYEDLRATNDQERQGKYSEDDLPLYPLLKQIERFRKELNLPMSFEDETSAPDFAEHIPHDESHVEESKSKQNDIAMAKWLNIKELMKEDEALQELLAPLQGTKESTIIVACHNAIHRSDDYLKVHHHSHHEGHEGDPDAHSEESRVQNIMAWVALRVLHLWYETKLQQNRTYRNEDADQLHFSEEEDLDFEDRIAHGELTEDELEALRNQVDAAAPYLHPEPSTSTTTQFSDPLANSWFKKAKENLSIMHIVAQETKRRLLPGNNHSNHSGGNLPEMGSSSTLDGSRSTLTDRSLPGSGMEIGPPVITRSALYYKDPEESQSSQATPRSKSGIAVESFALLDKTAGKSMKKSQPVTTELTQLSQLKDIDPFGKSKKPKKMITMKAHLTQLHAKTSDAMDSTASSGEYHMLAGHHQTMPVSASTSALPSAHKINKRLQPQTHQSTGQLRSSHNHGNSYNNNALAYTSHL